MSDARFSPVGGTPYGSPSVAGSVYESTRRPDGSATSSSSASRTPPKPTPTPPPAPAEFAPRRGGGSAIAVLALIGVLIVASGLAYLWWYPPSEETTGARLAALEQRLTTLEQRPSAPPSPPPAPTPAAPPVDLRPLAARIEALERRPLAAPAASPPAPATGPDAAALAARLDEMVAKQAAQAQQQARDLSALTERLAAAEARAAQAEQGATRAEQGARNAQQTATQAQQGVEQSAGQAASQTAAVAAIDARAQRLAKIQAAIAAMEAGQPLGSVPDAPSALAKFATTAPPTEAALRLRFNAAAQAARLASEPSTPDTPLLERMWARAQRTVTVRQGDRVLVGDPAAVIIGRAHERLEAGDLAGTLAVLKTLDAKAAAAMKPWTDDAQALLDARAALAAMAAHG